MREKIGLSVLFSGLRGLLLLMLIFFSVGSIWSPHNNGKLQAQNGSINAQNSQCPPIINSVTAQLLNIDTLQINVNFDDCDGNTTGAMTNLLDAGNHVIANANLTFNPPPTGRGPFSAQIMLTGVSNFLGSCSVQLILQDADGNMSAPMNVNFRDCSTPIVNPAQSQLTVVNGDQLRVSVRGGDPDEDTNSATVKVLSGSAVVLGPSSLDTSQITAGQHDFDLVLTINGISTVSNPNEVSVQLSDRLGHTSDELTFQFTPIKGKPDLVVTDITLNTSSGAPGASVNVSMSIKNNGDAPASASSGEVRLSTDRTINSNDVLLNSFSVAALNPGQVASGNITVTIPADTASGSYFIGVIADSSGQFKESNNTQSRPFTVMSVADKTPPTVQVQSPKAGDMVAPGGKLPIIFSSSDNVGVVSQDIDYSTDGGKTFSQIAHDLDGNFTSFDFNVPPDLDPAPQQAIVRVTARDAAGNSGFGLSGQFFIGDFVPPTVQITQPAGGEMLLAGMPFDIKFNGSDNDALAGFTIAYSTDGGQTFPNLIGQTGPGATDINWNIPDALQTTQARISVTARDRAGNNATAMSGIFSIQQPADVGPMLQIAISFTPPPAGQDAPPSNVQVNAMELKTRPGIAARGAFKANRQPAVIYDLTTNNNTASLVGFNVYRVPQPPDGQPLPPPEQIVNPINLVGAVDANATTFIDTVPAGKSSSGNYVYSLTSFFGDGSESNGSPPAGTSLPVIKDPMFIKGALFIDAGGSFIKSGDMLIVNDTEHYSLLFDDSGTRFTVGKKARSAPSGLPIKKVIKKGSAVRLVVLSATGKMSVEVTFTR